MSKNKLGMRTQNLEPFLIKHGIYSHYGLEKQPAHHAMISYSIAKSMAFAAAGVSGGRGVGLRHH